MILYVWVKLPSPDLSEDDNCLRTRYGVLHKARILTPTPEKRQGPAALKNRDSTQFGAKLWAGIKLLLTCIRLLISRLIKRFLYIKTSEVVSHLCEALLEDFFCGVHLS